MKKHFLNFIAVIVSVFCGLFVFSACKKVEFKVNFVVDGAVYATLNTNGNETVKMPKNPTKTEYEFDGWYWDKDTWQTPFTANSLLDAPLSSDMNVYCKWKPKTVRVSGISLNKSEVSLHVLWESSNATIATVTGGKITALRVGSATITATANDGGQIAVCEVKVVEDKIAFKSLQAVEGDDKVYGVVRNSTKTFSFLDEIEIYGDAEYQVYEEIGCKTLILSKTISLNEGDNVVYVLRTIGKATKLYTVTIRRKPIYTVTFNTKGGTEIQSQRIEEGFFATEPAEPSRVGYTFEKWQYDFSQAILSDTEIMAVWRANNDTVYKTEYYLQNLENNDYTLKETIVSRGATDTTANAEIKSFAHFTHKIAETDNGNILPDGSLVLKVYYTRDTYNVTFKGYEKDEQVQIIKYEGAAIAPQFIRIGYTFNGWDNVFTNISEDTIVTAQWKINQYTLTVVYGNGENDRIITQDYNSPIEKVALPKREGFDFDGWDKEFFETMPAEDCAITAKWVAIFRLSNAGDTIIGLSDYGKNRAEILIPQEIDGIKITNIDSGAFRNCNKAAYKEKDNLNYIGSKENNYLFLVTANKNLSTYNIDSECKYIGASAFNQCSNLTNIEIPNGIISIGNSAFSGCGSLLNVSLPNSIKVVEREAFNACSKLTNLEIPDSVVTIGYSAFYKCVGLENVRIGSGVRMIENHAFGQCVSLKNIIIEEGLTVIDINAFWNLASHPKMVIPSSVTTINRDAFNSYDLPIVFYKGTADQWNKLFSSNRLSTAPRYYYSETQPTESGNFWHYNKNGEIEEWQ